jgi:hypothetical protein
MRVTSRCIFVAAVGLLLIAIPPAFSQELPLRVSVDDAVYIVQGDTVTAEKAASPLDEFVTRKATLAARVFDKQILNSSLNRRFFDPVNRASIFADEQSDRLVEPWRKPLASTDTDNDERVIAAARTQFKAWAEKLADDPREAALAVVRQDYRDGIDAYRDNAAIYRSAMVDNKPLSYADALAFLDNQSAVTRLAAARAIEAQLADRSVTPPADIAASAIAGRASRLSQRIQADVIAKVDAAKTAADLEQINTSLRQVALAELPSLKDYDDGIRPAVIRLSGTAPQRTPAAPSLSGASSPVPATPSPTVTTSAPVTAAPTVNPPVTSPPSPAVTAAPPAIPAPSVPTVSVPTPQTPAVTPPTVNTAAPARPPVSSTVSVRVPLSAPKSLKPFGVAGGVTQPPYPAGSGTGGLAGGAKPVAAPARTWRSGIPETAPVGTPESLKTYSSKRYVAQDGYVFNPRDGVWQNPADPTQFRNPSVITCCDETGLAFPSDGADSDDSLKTFSSKGYHSSDGMVFNPHDGLWHDPKDPSRYRIPAVITCCDETGLAFPNDAIEAKQTYWLDLRGTDPNCNRLYDCKNPAVVTIDPNPTTDPGGPTERDAEILRGLAYLNQFPPDQRGPAIAKFLNSLSGALKNRAVYLLYQFNQTQPRSAPAPQTRAPVRYAPSGAALRQHSGHYRGGQRANNSTISGLGDDSRRKVTSRYEPITRTSAQNIVGRYKSIPGGVTLEGTGIDLPPLRTVVYLKESNAFIINDDLVYVSPVTAAEFLEMEKALREDDKLGVSLGTTQLVYGALPRYSDIAMTLKLADRFLGAIVFYHKNQLVHYKMAPGYNGRREGGSMLAVYFNFNEYKFERDDSGQIARAGVVMNATLVPLRADRGGDGGMLPDLDRIASNDLPESYVANIRHVQDNFAYYANERVLRRTIAYGEAASFLRSLKAAGIVPDFN